MYRYEKRWALAFLVMLAGIPLVVSGQTEHVSAARWHDDDEMEDMSGGVVTSAEETVRKNCWRTRAEGCGEGAVRKGCSRRTRGRCKRFSKTKKCQKSRRGESCERARACSPEDEAEEVTAGRRERRCMKRGSRAARSCAPKKRCVRRGKKRRESACQQDDRDAARSDRAE